MAFVDRGCKCFFMCFLLSLTLFFNNLEGTDMGAMSNFFNAMSLGNVNRLKVCI